MVCELVLVVSEKNMIGKMKRWLLASLRNTGVPLFPFFIPSPPFSDGQRIPQCVGYALRDVLHDLIVFSAKTLVVGGRLVYWLPTNKDYQETDLPLHPCLRVISNSLQLISSKWERRLITMEKIKPFNQMEHDSLPPEAFGQLAPAHGSFARFALDDPNRRDDHEFCKRTEERKK
jgi:tRNA (guanine10-N2)-methyltransferase